MTRALIGHTGFVGSNLSRQSDFDACYNSRNIESIRGRRFDLVVCCGAPGVKWKANKDPQRDLEGIRRLMNALEDVMAGEMVMVSTIDVYPVPRGVSESTEIDAGDSAPYGRHRLLLERFLQDRFRTTVLRLPGLFGPGLRKNVVYDLLTGKGLAYNSTESFYQLYDLGNLWQDLEKLRGMGTGLLNLTTEPLKVADIAREVFGMEEPQSGVDATVHYDVRSDHAERWGGGNGYIYDRDQVLDGLKRFVAWWRASES